MNAVNEVLGGERRWAVAYGDSLASLKAMPAESVQCCVTSPPYYALRDYGCSGQIGLERTPEEFVAKLVAVFAEVRRVLRKDGTCWVNMGDSYANDAKGPNGSPGPGLGGAANQPAVAKCWRGGTLKKKDLIGVPWMLAFAMRDGGWYLRGEQIWYKPNVMPESVTDRPVRCHEQVFLLSKSASYFYDAKAIDEPVSGTANSRGSGVNPKSATGDRNRTRQHAKFSAQVSALVERRNKRSVWRIPVARFSGAHFATFPPKLVEPCILAGTSARGCCPECGAPWARVVAKRRVPTRPGKDTKVTGDTMTDGNRDPRRHVTTTETTGWKAGCRCEAGEPIGCVVLDPFAGSGTTLAVAVEHGRRAVGCELNESYGELIRDRMAKVQPQLVLEG